jgi:isopentenyl-diphosphate delta-isomerase
MGKVAPINQRKSDHIKINLEQDVRSSLTTGLENIHFIHEALPEIDLEAIDSSVNIFGKKLKAPILVSSMTGGTQEAKRINQYLAEGAQAMGVALGVGSQRAAIEDPDLSGTYSITRKVAPDILLFANLGAVQLNYGYALSHCRRAIEMLDANALILHLNPLQEAVQVGGNTNFAGLANKIEDICHKVEVPVVVKEVGWGISERTAKLLENCGVAAIDVAGAGGTSWSQVEMHRADDEFTRELAATYHDWGINTVDSIRNIKKGAPKMIVLASGGLKNGLDISKCIALGAELGGMAGQFLKAAAESSTKVIEMLRLVRQQIIVTMFAAGTMDIPALQRVKLNEKLS